jgi:riboflavin biosynthesis pyrimidine reductase
MTTFSVLIPPTFATVTSKGRPAAAGRSACVGDDGRAEIGRAAGAPSSPNTTSPATTAIVAPSETTIAAGDTAEEVDKLRRGGDGHIVVWGGITLWRSLMRLDLIDELQVSLFPYGAGEGTRPFDAVPKSYRLDLVSSTASSSGIVELQYRRHR